MKSKSIPVTKLSQRAAAPAAGLLSLCLLHAVACGAAEEADAGAAQAGDGGTPRDDGGGQDPSAQLRETLVEHSPAELPAPPADLSNAHADDPKAAALGQKLFFDTRFSGALLDGDNDGSVNALGVRGQTGRVACAGCHLPDAGFSDDRTLGGAISLAAGWGHRRTPSLLDVGQAKLLMWDGRHDTLYNQVFGPIESAVEMNSSRLFAAQQVFANHRAEYEAVFGALPPLDDTSRFPALSGVLTGCQHIDRTQTPAVCDGTKHGMPGDHAEFDGMAAEDQDVVTSVVVNVGKAMGAYERLLSCGASRFDVWMQGQSDALSAAEQRGAALFVGKARCVECHSGPFFSDQKFHNVGLKAATVSLVFQAQNDLGAIAGLTAALDDPLNVRGVFSDGDDGRLPSAVNSNMEGAFRTPTLRCVDQRPRLMHTGQLRSLEEVVAFFSRGGDSGGYPGKNELQPVNLDANEQADLVHFLRALRGPGPARDLLR
jgi:cytochrome c peroxidase